MLTPFPFLVVGTGDVSAAGPRENSQQRQRDKDNDRFHDGPPFQLDRCFSSTGFTCQREMNALAREWAIGNQGALIKRGEHDGGHGHINPWYISNFIKQAL